MDRLSGSDIATRVGARTLDSRTFPDTRALSSRLGVSLRPGKSATFDKRAPAAAIRRAIMSGGAPP